MSGIKELFFSIQEQLSADLRGARSILSHPGAKGDASETNWITMLESHLPHRYQVSKGFVLDSNGNCSDQIDIIIYDRQYTPLLYNHSGQRFIPCESVYGVIEVKQVIDRSNLEYAGKKAASVRKLERTSTAITHAGGKYEPRPLTPILASIVAYESNWSPPLGNSLSVTLEMLDVNARIDLGCALSNGCFEAVYLTNGKVDLRRSENSIALLSFFLSLLQRLQAVGTVPAIDYAQYRKALEFDKL